ncbi:hypothetical protein GF314_15355 [bacterium]|nr:hypothetical protein [bacterium]
MEPTTIDRGAATMIHARQTSRLAVLGVLILVGVTPALGVTLSFDPANATFIGDAQQTVAVMADQIDDLLGATLTITYDPAVVTAADVAPGTLIDDAPCSYFFDVTMDTPGEVRIDVAFFGCTASGTGALVTVTFEGAGGGTSPLVITGTDLRDSENEIIDVAVEDGSITYVPEITSALAFTPDPAYTDETGTVEVCLELTDVADFLGMSVEFGFDPMIVVPTAVTAGPALEGFGCDYYLTWVDAGEIVDSVQIDTALLGCSGPVDGSLVCITFEGVDPGESPLTWLAVDVRSSDNAPVPVNTTDGTIVYDQAIATETASLSTIKSRFRD